MEVGLKRKSVALSAVLAVSLLALATPAYASSASGQFDAAIQPGTISILKTTPSSATIPVNSSATVPLPSATWSDATGSGQGWSGYLALSDLSYTGTWTPLSGAPSLASTNAGNYTGTNDGDTYTVTVTAVSGSTVSYSFTSSSGASGTGSATLGSASTVGTNGIAITFAASTTYAAGDSYQVHIGTQNSSAVVLANQSTQAKITPVSGSNASPVFINQSATVSGAPGTYGSAVPFISASPFSGMGQYSIQPQATITTDVNSWAATYTASAQYTIVSGPVSTAASASTSNGTTTATLLGSTDITYTGSTANVTVPSGTAYVVATISGAGGGGGSNDSNTYGGAGALVKAEIPVSSGETLVALVGSAGATSGAGSGGGGGLSGLFDGTPSQSTALAIAGGGGGGANDGVANTQSNGTAGGFSPVLPLSSSTGALGGAGYGGGGANQNGGDAANGVPFGLVTAPSCTISGAGGYGGGANGGCQWGGGGGAGGYVGGQGGNSWSGSGTPTGSGGQGGQSYLSSTSTLIQAITGGGGSGGYATAGSNGSIQLTFYS